ncbi:MAG: hypothetical protein ACTJHU_04105 [Mycetocola sp.]
MTLDKHTPASADLPGALTFRTVWGGPVVQPGVIEELGRIKQHARTVPLAYSFDLSLLVGGDITPGEGPSGLTSPRVSTARRTVTGTIQITRDEVDAAADPVGFVRQTIQSAIDDLITRIAARDGNYDAEAERQRLVFVGTESA